jgi:UDP-N-acetyl-D-glucosamine dehydrogenase
MNKKYIKILKKIRKKKHLKIGIIGMGYVGLPLALTACEANFFVYGFDKDLVKVKKLSNNISYINHIKDSRIKKITKKKLFFPTTDLSLISNVDFIIICLPTPLTQNKLPDLKYIKNCIHELSKFNLDSKVIILESTTYPGTSQEFIINKINKKNLIESKDYFVCYSPEREDPGNKKYKTKQIPKVMGGSSKLSLSLGYSLYKQIFKKVVKVSSLEIAEATKIYENVFRSINIALVNELKFAFQKLKIDIWEVIKASSTKPFGFMPFYPGPGLGGHCIPIDPIYLSWKCSKHGFDCKFIKLAEKINSEIPYKIINKVNLLFKKQSNKKILIIGLAYKKNIDDYRESPSLKIFSNLINLYKVNYHDKYIKFIGNNRHYKLLNGTKSVSLNKSKLRSYDLVILLTDHDYLDYNFILKNSRLIIDTRNVFVKNKKVIKM